MKPVSLFFALCAAAILSGCGGKKETAKSSGPDLPAGELSGTISISAYETMIYRSFLEDAARSFQALHPGTTVNVETFSAMPEIRSGSRGNAGVTQIQMLDDPQGRADYISRVNTGLMSGEGADIYALDVLPLHKFVESGQFENLETFMDGDSGFNREDYRGNILDALSYRGGIWFMPTGYTFKYFTYDSTLIPDAAGFGTGKAWTTGELLAMGEQYYNGTEKIFNLVDYSTNGGLAHQMLTENFGTYVDLEQNKANFVRGGFAGFLELVRNAGERGYVHRGVTGQDAAEIMLREAGEEVTGRSFFKLKNDFSLISHFGRGAGMRMQTWTGGEARAIEDDDEIAGIAANAAGGVPFTYMRAYGISSASKNKALAWAFIKFLLDEETQLSNAAQSAGDLPLHNKARKQKAELTFSGAFGGRALNAGMKTAQEKYMAVVEDLSDQINCFAVRDTTVNDMIAGELSYYFGGSRTAEQLAAVLQNKVDLYLNE
ncbi:MAG: ABC transporter substrate-binding protein [Treponema sp.]|jgi:multiple sugar transport system substrate-binding protein|nr:ABC transporter substrate-binding protein [Treponema sp.]